MSKDDEKNKRKTHDHPGVVSKVLHTAKSAMDEAGHEVKKAEHAVVGAARKIEKNIEHKVHEAEAKIAAIFTSGKDGLTIYEGPGSFQYLGKNDDGSLKVKVNGSDVYEVYNPKDDTYYASHVPKGNFGFDNNSDIEKTIAVLERNDMDPETGKSKPIQYSDGYPTIEPGITLLRVPSPTKDNPNRVASMTAAELVKNNVKLDIDGVKVNFGDLKNGTDFTGQQKYALLQMKLAEKTADAYTRFGLGFMRSGEHIQQSITSFVYNVDISKIGQPLVDAVAAKDAKAVARIEGLYTYANGKDNQGLHNRRDDFEKPIALDKKVNWDAKSDELKYWSQLQGGSEVAANKEVTAPVAPQAPAAPVIAANSPPKQLQTISIPIDYSVKKPLDEKKCLTAAQILQNTYDGSSVISHKSSYDKILAVKSGLCAAGYLSEEDAKHPKLDDKYKTALQNAQEDFGLKKDGVAGVRTIETLQNFLQAGGDQKKLGSTERAREQATDSAKQLADSGSRVEHTNHTRADTNFSKPHVQGERAAPAKGPSIQS